jgi:hypothetical protein
MLLSYVIIYSLEMGILARLSSEIEQAYVDFLDKAQTLS